MKKFGLLLFLLALFSAQLFAHGYVDVRPGETLGNALSRVGVPERYMNDVMRENRIGTNPPVGTLVKVPYGYVTGEYGWSPLAVSQKTRPTEKTSATQTTSTTSTPEPTTSSEALPETISEDGITLAGMEEEIRGLRNRISALMTENERVRYRISAFATENNDLRIHLASVTESNSFFSSRPRGFWIAVFALSLLGFALAGLIVFLFFRKQKEKLEEENVISPKKIPFFVPGRKEPFVFEMAEEAKYKCPSCHENNLLQKNVERHMTRAHLDMYPSNQATSNAPTFSSSTAKRTP